ncbi:MAG TPA: hypothetical protein VLU25_17755 [Acidobacteriota bacterium]|nr:hypothetical protein [Acidobacteriota bacterium]
MKKRRTYVANRRTVRAIAGLEGRYRSEFLDSSPGRLALLDQDWLAGLLFFLEHVYPQGRNDDLSMRYYKSAENVICKWFRPVESKAEDAIKACAKQQWLPTRASWWTDGSFSSPLTKALSRENAGKRRDIEMVVDSLRFVLTLPDRNLVRFSRSEVRAGRVTEHYKLLQELRQVGPKTASLYLRDLCTLYSLTPDPEQLVSILPVDTWVRQVCEWLGVVSADDTESLVRERIVDLCEAASVSPAEFNCGAWYLGRGSFRLCLELLATRS